MNDYEDIINLERPKSKHPKMPIEERSALFSSFDPLDGYDESIKKSNIIKDEKRILSEEEKQIINDKLLNKDKINSIVYYDNKIFKYVRTFSKLKKIDIINKQILLDNHIKINIDDIKKID